MKKQLMNCVCFAEDGAVKTIAVNLQGDLVLSTNFATDGHLFASKHLIDTCVADPTNAGGVYYTSETQVFRL